jgi:hypothetical protein
MCLLLQETFAKKRESKERSIDEEIGEICL